MQVNLEMLLKVCFANNQQALILKALEMEMFPTPTAAPETIVYAVPTSTMKKLGYVVNEKEYRMNVSCKVLDYQPLRVSEQYYIEFPDGQRCWVNSSNDAPAVLVKEPIAVPAT